MDTQLLARLPVEQARCRELARQFSAMGSIGCFAAALVEEALRRADRAIIEGCEDGVRRALRELEAFGSTTPAPAATPARAREAMELRAVAATPARGPHLALAVPPVGRRPPRAQLVA